MVDALPHVDWIDLHPMKVAVARDPWVRIGGRDIERLSYAIEDTSRYAALDWDIVNQDLAEKKTGHVMGDIQNCRENERRAAKPLENHGKNAMR